MIDTARDDHRGTTAAENDGGGEGRRAAKFPSMLVLRIDFG
jgi:hypothetical protein